MFKIFFENSRREWKKVGEGTERECRKAMMDFLASKHFKSYYSNEFDIDVGVRRIDVGSHTEFFYLVDMSKATLKVT